MVLEKEIIVDTNELWNAKLDAEFNEKYWDMYYSKHYFVVDQIARVVLTISSPGTLFGILREAERIMVIISAFSATVAAILSSLGWKEKYDALVHLRENWGLLSSKYRKLWYAFTTNRKNAVEINTELKTLQELEESLIKYDKKFPDNESLILKAYEIVYKKNS